MKVGEELDMDRCNHNEYQTVTQQRVYIVWCIRVSLFQGPSE